MLTLFKMMSAQVFTKLLYINSACATHIIHGAGLGISKFE